MARERLDRAAVVDRLADEVGVRWAKAWLDELRGDGRLPSGGWPGTLTEARTRVAHTGRPLELTNGESMLAARRAIQVARRAWTAAAKPGRRGVSGMGA